MKTQKMYKNISLFAISVAVFSAGVFGFGGVVGAQTINVSDLGYGSSSFGTLSGSGGSAFDSGVIGGSGFNFGDMTAPASYSNFGSASYGNIGGYDYFSPNFGSYDMGTYSTGHTNYDFGGYDYAFMNSYAGAPAFGNYDGFGNINFEYGNNFDFGVIDYDFGDAGYISPNFTNYNNFDFGGYDYAFMNSDSTYGFDPNYNFGDASIGFEYGNHFDSGVVDWDYEWEGYSYPSADGGYFAPLDYNTFNSFTPIDDGACDGCGPSAPVVSESSPINNFGASGNRYNAFQNTTPQYNQTRGGGSGFGNIVSDLLDFGLSISSVKSDNDTNIKTDSHDKTTYTVKNTDNSNRSVRVVNKYVDNSVTDNSVTIDDNSVTSYVIVEGEDNGNGSYDYDLSVVCRVSDSTVREGDVVRFQADAYGGNGSYYYDWRGDIDGDNPTEDIRFNQEGRYQVSVMVEDRNGDVVTDDCPDIIVDNDNSYTGINVLANTNGTNANSNSSSNTAPSGNLASLGSVFLSQIPYTGTDGSVVWKIALAIILVLAWSFAVVYFMSKRKKIEKNKNQMLSDFKNQNRLATQIV